MARFQHLKNWLIAGGVVIIFIVIVALLDNRNLTRLLREIDWLMILPAVGAMLGGFVLLTFRWRYILGNKPGWRDTFYANSAGFMLHALFFTPSVVTRGITTNWITHLEPPKVVTSIFVEQFMDIIMRIVMVMLLLLVATLNHTNITPTNYGNIFLLLFVFGAVFLMVTYRQQVANGLDGLLRRFSKMNEAQRKNMTNNLINGLETLSSKRRLAITLALSLAVWSCFFVFQFLILDALPVDLSFQQMVLAAGVALTIMPPTNNFTLGFYHAVVISTLLMMGLTTSATAVVYAISIHLLLLTGWVILGRWSFIRTGITFQEMLNEAKERAKSFRASTAPTSDNTDQQPT
jgi:hypothetical protein